MHTETQKLYQEHIQKGGFSMNLSREEKIYSYLKSCMTDEEVMAFESELQEDDTLRKETVRQALAIKSIRNCACREDERMLKAMSSMSEEDFKLQLKSKVMSTSVPKRHSMWPAWAAVAAACIGGVMYFHTQSNFYNNLTIELKDAQALLESPAQQTLRGGDADWASFQKLQQSADYILQKNYPRAILLLESIVKEGDINHYYQDACWQLSLCYILNKDNQKAIPLLQQIIAEKQYQAEKAHSLLRKLE